MKIIIASGEDKHVIDYAQATVSATVSPKGGFEYVTCNVSQTAAIRRKKAAAIADFLGCLNAGRPRRIIDAMEAMDTRFDAQVAPKTDTRVIYFAGGDARDYLKFLRGAGAAYMNFIRTNWENPEVVCTGAAAGAMIWGNSLDGWDYYQMMRDKQEARSGHFDLFALNVFRAQIVPHYGSMLGSFAPASIQRTLMRKAIRGYWKNIDPSQAESFVLMPNTAALEVDTVKKTSMLIGTGAMVYSKNGLMPLTNSLLAAMVNFGMPHLN